ncbi:MAG: hypothetical protein AB7O96_14340 [Pseudobdellovibrionaceae bacterium]
MNRFIALVIALFVAAPAFARSMRPSVDFMYSDVKIGGKLTNHIALAKVDFLQYTIEIQILNDPCGQYAPAEVGVIRCMAAAQLVYEFTVPLQKSEKSCGSVYYSGTSDMMPVDGPKTEIVVADHSERMCTDLVVGAKEARVVTTSPRPLKVTEFVLSGN